MSTDATPIPPASPLASDVPRLPDDLATCQQMLRELLATVAQLRATIDKQQAHIHYLVRMTVNTHERLTHLQSREIDPPGSRV
jgi:uncharacterized coiled-coil protein SlyX